MKSAETAIEFAVPRVANTAARYRSRIPELIRGAVAEELQMFLERQAARRDAPGPRAVVRNGY